MLGARAIDNRVAKLEELEAKKKAVEAEIEKVRAELTGEMVDLGTDELHGSKFLVSYKDIVSNRFDTTKFKKDHASLYSAYLRVSMSKRFGFKAVA